MTTAQGDNALYQCFNIGDGTEPQSLYGEYYYIVANNHIARILLHRC